MKKLYYLLGAILISTVSFAQNRLDDKGTIGVSMQTLDIKKLSNNAKGIGDTAFFFDGRDFFITDPSDVSDFVLNNLDFDGQQPQNSTTWPSEFIYSFYSLDPLDSLPGDGDTSWYIGAGSWFASPGKADNWWTFGPITIGTNGTFSWYNKSNPAWTDAYDVYITTSVASITNGYQPYTDVDPAVNTPVYTKVGISSPNPQPASDTLWTQASVSLAAYAGQRIWIAFNHDMFDGDVCYLDHMRVTSDITGITEKDASTSVNVYPNPSKGITNVNISLANLSNVEMNILDITGKKVWSQNAGSMTAGTYNVKVDVSNFESGVYFYQLITETGTTTKKLYVVK